MWPWRVKLVQVVSVAVVDDEDRVGDSKLQIWKWGLVIKVNFCSDFEHKVWSKFNRDAEAEVWSIFCCWCLVEVMKLNLGSKARFGHDFNPICPDLGIYAPSAMYLRIYVQIHQWPTNEKWPTTIIFWRGFGHPNFMILFNIVNHS